MDDAALEQIQTKIAFLEGANAELSDLVFRQHREIEALAAKLAQLSDRLTAVLSEDRGRAPDQERPPHY